MSRRTTLPGVSDLFLKQGQDLTISHVITGFQLAFPAFLEMFSDAYTCNWNEEGVYGRMDAIPTFRNTQRTLSIAWNVPAESFENAAENVAKVNQLVSYLYPLYDNTYGAVGATTINQSPLVRVSFGNLVQNAVDGRGLLGYLQGITFDPALEFGMFTRKGSGQRGRSLVDREGIRHQRRKQNLTITEQDAEMEYYPKTFRLNFELTVLHEHELGFAIRKGSFAPTDRVVNFANFPYATGGVSDITTNQRPLVTTKSVRNTADPLSPTNAISEEILQNEPKAVPVTPTPTEEESIPVAPDNPHHGGNVPIGPRKI